MVRTLPKSEQPPHALYRAAQVRKFDRIAIEEFGMAGGLLMQRAGNAAFALRCFENALQATGRGGRIEVVTDGTGQAWATQPSLSASRLCMSASFRR